MGSLRFYWLQLRSSLWFVPFLLSLAAVGAALALMSHGEALSAALGLEWLRFSDPTAARGLLESLVNGMISMTALVVSITMVVLTLAAAQLGPRLIRDFTDDFVTQLVLGLFIGTILYLLVVLHGIDTHRNADLPDLAITLGSLLCAACLFVLLLYINRLARSIVSNHLLRRVALDISRTSAYLQTFGGTGARRGEDEDEGEALAWDPSAPSSCVSTSKEGYVENLDYASILSACDTADTVVLLSCRPGQWVNEGDVIAQVAPPSASDRLKKVLDEALAVGSTRTPSEDLEFGLQRLVEVGLRALSPSLNDSFTAIAAVDNVGACMARMFSREQQRALLRGRSGKVRVICPVVDWASLVNAGFDQLRQSGAVLPAVANRLVDTLGRLAPYIKEEDQRLALQDQLDAVLESAKLENMVGKDAASLRERYSAARIALAAALPGLSTASAAAEPRADAAESRAAGVGPERKRTGQG